MRILVQFYMYYGRMGKIDGLFVTTTQRLEASWGKRCEMGEILGKHSDIGFELDKTQFNVKSYEQDFIKKLLEVMGEENPDSNDFNICGYNPLEYVEDFEEDIE